MTVIEKVAARMKKLTLQRRCKAILGRRFCYNVCRWPWAFMLAVLLFVALVYAMTMVNIPLPGDGNFPVLLIFLWDFSNKLAIMIIFILVIAAVFTISPYKAQTYEAALVNIGLTDHYGNAPALVSRRKLKSANANNQELIFYSDGVDLEKWMKLKGKIESALNLTYLCEPQNAFGKRYYVMLTVASGIAEPRKKTLYDDEL